MTSTTTAHRKLSGKVAIVTGSTKGIGLAIARRLGQDGAKVMISSRKQENVDKAVKELRAESLEVAGTVCHVGKPEDRSDLIKETVSKLGGIDILVCNAAVSPLSAVGPILDCTESHWDKIMDTNLKSAFFFCKEVAPYMKERGGGSVVFISTRSVYDMVEEIGLYTISKTGLLALARALTPQLASMNIRVNCVSPGLIRTEMSAIWWKNAEQLKGAEQRIALRRIGEPSECSGIVSFLVSEDASYITGENVLVTGGVPDRI